MESNVSPYVIFSLNNNDFIQCAGGIKSLVVEARFYEGDSFKHFIIGKKEMSNVWHTIECKVGPIRVLGHEVLNVDEALELFSYFYFENDILPTYNKRNITKQFA
ncbi:hypothetical protein [Pedobacter nyackensis]|uniref:hypothetical protein n=1 Tax=Pedobacter nyackensis TaxID=475255 RepID=UPI00292F8E30|nr:hypothetical protein [Pedobacter nyackensis]